MLVPALRSAKPLVFITRMQFLSLGREIAFFAAAKEKLDTTACNSPRNQRSSEVTMRQERIRGSSQSRMASPSRLNARTVIMIASAGKITK